ncbi:MAG: polysaccharide pyruvyl transferase family protein [Pseudomonadota bacterium]
MRIEKFVEPGRYPEQLPEVRIALVNVASDSNRGACALTWASLDLLFRAFPHASIAIVPAAESETRADPPPFRHTARRYPGVAILPPLFDGQGRAAPMLIWRLARSLSELFRFDRKRPNRNSTLEWIRNCALVVSVGGVTFETYGGTLRHDARFLARVLPLLAAWKIDVPAVFVGAQIGPFNTRLGGWLFGWLAAKAAVVFPRDKVSEAEFRRQVADPRCIPLPDSAFALKLPAVGMNDLFARHGLDAGVATLVLVISSALGPDESADAHVALFSQVATRLVESGLFPQIVIVVQHDEDSPGSRRLARKLQLDARCVIDEDLDPGQLSSLYGACRMVVSSRLHAVILAMLAGVPAISLAPEVTFKEHAVLDMVGLASLCVPTRVGPSDATRFCLDVAGDLERHGRAVAAAVAAAQEKLAEVPHHLREAVASRRGFVA